MEIAAEISVKRTSVDGGVPTPTPVTFARGQRFISSLGVRSIDEEKKLIAFDCNAAAFIWQLRGSVRSNEDCEGGHDAHETARAAFRFVMAGRSELGKVERRRGRQSYCCAHPVRIVRDGTEWRGVSRCAQEY